MEVVSEYPALEEISGNQIYRGEVFVFPKLNGTGVCIYFDDYIKFVKRSSCKDFNEDEQGIVDKYTIDTKLNAFFWKYPTLVLHAEMLTREPWNRDDYRWEAFKEMYIHDVYDPGQRIFLHYEDYKDHILRFGMRNIPSVESFMNPIYNDLIDCLGEANFQKNAYTRSVVEGLVIKNYTMQLFQKIMNPVWLARKAGKVITMPTVIPKRDIEEDLLGNCIEPFESYFVKKYMTEQIVDISYSSLIRTYNGWDKKYISNLFNMVYMDFIRNYMVTLLTENKDANVDFSVVRRTVVDEVKKKKPELFK